MRVVIVGALNGLVAVALGAIGAHLFGDQVATADDGLIETAIMFQLVHAAVLVAMGGLIGHVYPALLAAAAWALGLGVVLFCGSLYVMGFGIVDDVSVVAPVGGGLLLLGWFLLAIAGARRN